LSDTDKLLDLKLGQSLDKQDAVKQGRKNEVKSSKVAPERLERCLFTCRFAREVSSGKDCNFSRASL